MLDFGKARLGYHTTPCGQVVIDAITVAAPALLILATRVGAEQDARRLQCCLQLLQPPKQFRTRHMEQSRVGEYALELAVRQIQSQQIMQPNLATGPIRSETCRARVCPYG